ncbi:hypothetical protein EYZ11_011546 [Aspergillus tanneri]|uniref:CREG-like beta-barrel domain-containing protein n=1 Tax=Aspergillus tanneri TaxID=1220188 RepID=A0A4S3J2W2_9EURO|nr:hypothetical protein EYZ11_011546 [Aspergillus tanneri]
MASCDDTGNPTILAPHLGTTFKNVAAGSNVTLSIDWWDHLTDTDVSFSGLSPSRMALSPLDTETRVGLEQCFVDVHPDTRVWLPD